jgi:HAD superfamily hydrolase (TIGR01509 family)
VSRPPLAEVEAVVFDMDGVLIDSEPLHYQATRQMMAELGVEYGLADHQQFFGWTDLDMFRTLRERHRLAPEPDALAREYVGRVIALLDQRAAMPGVPAVPRGLRQRGYRLAVASSSAPASIAAVLRVLDLTDVFERVASGVEVGRSKPAPDVFLLAAERLGVAPRRCLVVEDSRNGVVGARNAGMPCAAIPCPATRHQDFAEADIRLDSLEDLPALLPGR